MAIVGTGDLESEIKLKAAEMGLSNNVTFLGFLNNPAKVLYDSKLMIMTSRWKETQCARWRRCR